MSGHAHEADHAAGVVEDVRLQPAGLLPRVHEESAELVVGVRRLRVLLREPRDTLAPDRRRQPEATEVRLLGEVALLRLLQFRHGEAVLRRGLPQLVRRLVDVVTELLHEPGHLDLTIQVPLLFQVLVVFILGVVGVIVLPTLRFHPGVRQLVVGVGLGVVTGLPVLLRDLHVRRQGGPVLVELRLELVDGAVLQAHVDHLQVHVRELFVPLRDAAAADVEPLLQLLLVLFLGEVHLEGLGGLLVDDRHLGGDGGVLVLVALVQVLERLAHGVLHELHAVHLDRVEHALTLQVSLEERRERLVVGQAHARPAQLVTDEGLRSGQGRRRTGGLRRLGQDQHVPREQPRIGLLQTSLSLEDVEPLRVVPGEGLNELPVLFRPDLHGLIRSRDVEGPHDLVGRTEEETLDGAPGPESEQPEHHDRED